ncbi:hypothetical protein Ocin01_05661 [Orchesella cincta]|uniref:PH domain-containing protein n=1 Tax=Orchesella cincta TaxID=48709 RepID=A0A1D2N6X2_ORCCI|nr:hypothetical protein Ocin01_05661 [Orchesella cincta]
MLQTPGSSPRRANGAENSSGNSNAEDESSRVLSQGSEAQKKTENYSTLTPRGGNYQNQYPRQRQFPRNAGRNSGTPPNYFPPLIQEHGRWEFPENYAGYNAARLGPPRRAQTRSQLISSHYPNFPQLPTLAHERIRELGNEIVACYAVQLCKFYDNSLIETTPHSFAVFTKKNRTGQRWLMVFRHDRGRVTVKYNRLLTNQLLVRCLNPVSVEVEPARSLGNIPQETCVFTFTCHSEANKFILDINESQCTAWNHREVFLEQSMRSQADHYIAQSAANMGYFSPRPLSARAIPSGYLVQAVVDKSPSLTPRGMRILPPIGPQNRTKRTPFTVSARTPRADLDENWRNREAVSPHSTDADYNRPSTPSSTTQSPMKKRSKGSSNDGGSNNNYIGGSGDGDFVYNSLTHAMALPTGYYKKRRFPASDVLVSNKRDVGTGAPDEEFFSLGSGEIQLIDNGEDQFDEIKCLSSEGQLMFSQILYGWNKVRHAEGSQNPKLRWWIGAAMIGCGAPNGETPRIREFKATFADEESAEKFVELFQEGANKGNNPEVRKKYLAQSLRV